MTELLLPELLRNIAFGAMTGVAVAGWVINRRLERALKEAADEMRSGAEILGECGNRLLEYADYKLAEKTSRMSETLVEERPDAPAPCFAVYREARGIKFDVVQLCYDPTDPDDREYKRVHAEEVAEMLNEKP